MIHGAQSQIEQIVHINLLRWASTRVAQAYTALIYFIIEFSINAIATNIHIYCSEMKISYLVYKLVCPIFQFVCELMSSFFFFKMFAMWDSHTIVHTHIYIYMYICMYVCVYMHDVDISKRN